jgi:hypothetical protein
LYEHSPIRTFVKGDDLYILSLYFVTRISNKFLYNMRYTMIKVVFRIMDFGLDGLEFQLLGYVYYLVCTRAVFRDVKTTVT